MNAPSPQPAPLAPLSPHQAGLLSEHLLGGSAREHDLEQLEVSLEAEPDEAVLARAWSFVASWRPALTTRFRWRGVPVAVQEPQPGVALPVARLDWRGLPAAEQARRREQLLDADRRRGFDLAVAPLMRVTVLALGGGRASLLWTVHPILLDDRAFADVLLQVFAAYDALRDGAEPRAPQASALGSTDALAGRDAAAARAFFQALLEGKAAPTPLPCAEPAGRPLPELGHGEAHLVLSLEASAGLERLAGARGTTVGTVVQAAWALVLSRLTGESDVLFGVTPSLRRTTLAGEAERRAALTAEAVPARLRIDEGGTVAALLAAVEAQAAAAAPHLHTPLAELEALGAFPTGTPLFETVLGFDARRLEPPRTASTPGWAQRRCQLHRQSAMPLAVSVVHDGETALAVRYDRRRYRPAVAARIATYLATTLERLGQVERVGEVDVLPEAERRLLLEGWNETAAPFGDTLLIHQPFERQADLQGEAVAVECEGQRLTFAELETRANRLANALAARGLGPGCYVGLCLGRGLGLVTGLLGIAKSGAAYVPLDPDYPRQRLAFMLADAGATVVVSEARFAGSFDLPVLELEAPEVSDASPRRPPARATADQPCYAIYTSGSTGTPKGVELAHRAVLNTLEWVSRSFAVQPGDRLLFVTSPCFDLSVYDTFGVLGAGATVVVASAERLAEPRQVVRVLVEAGITIWDSAPAALQRLVPFFPPRAELALRLVLLSGDWIPLSLPDAVRRAFPRAQVVSLGGATEAAIWSNWFPVEAIDPRWTSVPYGRPIQNARYYVLDGRRQPVARGVQGDLYIAGACLARGYLRRLELTAERFVPCPFVPGERMYRTGDLARHFEDGALEFLGRADFQVKVRGYRVELGEVEAALLAVDGVREAVATTFVDATGTRALVAYVVPTAGAGPSPDSVRASLAASLPDFMVPARVLVLAALPLSGSGKLDRRALPAPGTQAAGSRAHVPPRSDAERRMVASWEAVLEQHPIGLTDNFFQLGGDSLLAVVLSARLEQELGIELPLSRLLARPTVEGLLASLAEPAAPGRHLVTLTPAAPGSRAPLVLLSGVGGFGFFFQGLAHRLGGAQPVHVLHAVGAEDEREGLEHTIEELAAIYEPQVLAACPSGPVVLGGYSLGALIAFELTRRLVARGREVPLLVSFDGMAPGHPQLVPMPERLLLHLGAFLMRDGSGRRDYLRGRLDRLKGRFQAEAKGDPRLAAIEGPARAMAARLERVAAGLWWARDRYAPTGTVAADVLLLKATEPQEWPGCRSDGRYGWGDATRGRVDVEPVPGRHHGLFNPANNERMARVLAAHLELLAAR